MTMPDLTFDDLIPQRQPSQVSQSQGLSFDDLIPTARESSAKKEPSYLNSFGNYLDAGAAALWRIPHDISTYMGYVPPNTATAHYGADYEHNPEGAAKAREEEEWRDSRPNARRIADTALFAANLPIGMMMGGRAGLADYVEPLAPQTATTMRQSLADFSRANESALQTVGDVGAFAQGASPLGMPAPEMTPSTRPFFSGDLSVPRNPTPQGPPPSVAAPVPSPAPIPTPPVVGTPVPRNELLGAAARLDARLKAAEPEGPGMPIPTYAASDWRSVPQISQPLQELPIVGDPIWRAGQQSLEQLAKAKDVVGEGLGAGEKYTAGSGAKSAISDWIESKGGGEFRQNYDFLDKLVDPSKKARLTTTDIVAGQLEGEQAASASRVNDSAINLVRDAVLRPEGLTFDGLKRLRTEIGSRINGKIVPEPGTSQPALGRLYQALTADIAGNLKDYALPRKQSQIREAFERANAEYSRFSKQRKELTKIIGERDDAPAELVFDRLHNMAKANNGSDVTKLNLAKTAMSVMGKDAWNEVGSAIIARMGVNRKGEFAPATFLNDYNSLSSEGKTTLFGSPQTTSGVRQALDDIATISKRFNDIRAFGNPSGTGRLGSVVTAGTTVGMGLATGNILPPLGVLATAIGGRALANRLSRPVTAQAIADWSRVYTGNVSNAAQVSGRSSVNPAAVIGPRMASSDMIRANARLARALAQASGANPKDIEGRLNETLQPAAAPVQSTPPPRMAPTSEGVPEYANPL